MSLDAFLKGDAPPDPPPEAPAPEPAAPEPEATPEPEPEAEPAPQTPDGRTVPLAALEAERAQRRDHKERAAKLEGELNEVRRQLEEARRPREVERQPPPPINPAEDPQGFVQRVHEAMLNERLNTSQMMAQRDLARELGGNEAAVAAINTATAEFQQAAAANPKLMSDLHGQPHPYEWMLKQVEVIRAQREIGDDPAAYKARLRAEIEAEMNGGTATAPAPRLNLPPSLAGVRSSAPRTAPAWNGPPPIEALFPKK